jgi:anti-sigma regulatory factor (Ser/Thr protein kinase)
MPRMRMEQIATPECVPEARRRVSEIARERGLSPDVRKRVALAVTEATSNVVTHAYREQAECGELRVEAYVDGEALVVVVSDDGCGLTPRHDSPGLGLGLPLMARLATSLDIVDGGHSSPRRGMTVRMAFRVQ